MKVICVATVLFSEKEVAFLRDWQRYPNIDLIAKYSSVSHPSLITRCKEIDLLIIEDRIFRIEGYQGVSKVKAINPNLKLILLSSNLSALNLRTLFDHGLKAVIQAEYSFEEVRITIEEVYSSKTYVNKYKTTSKVKPENLSTTTRKKTASGVNDLEYKILLGMCEDRSLSEIASFLNVSVRTVERTRKKLFQKLGARTPSGLVIAALVKSLIDINMIASKTYY